MSCNECDDCVCVEAIPTCTTDITICDDLGLTTMYGFTYVYIQNLATDQISIFEAIIDDGKVVVTPNMAFHPEIKYRLWINSTQQTPFYQNVMTIDGVEAYCVEFDVFRFFDSEHISISQFNAVLQITTRV